MKKLFNLLTCVISFQLLFSQTNELPECRNTKEKLTQVNKSFDRFVEDFASKEDKVSLIKTYFSEFSICEQKGKIKDYGRNIEFIFSFTDADYKGNRTQFRDFYKKLFKEVKQEFASSHVYKISKEEDAKSSYFYEKDKQMSSSKRNIRLLLAYKDPDDHSTAYSVSLIFDYYPKR